MADKKDKLTPIRSRMSKRFDDPEFFKSPDQVELWSKQREEFKKIDKQILSTLQKESSRPVQLSWLPTRTARTSFFIPISDRDLKDAYTDIEYKSAWGTVSISGPPLNTVDEGIFLALLYYVKEKQSPVVKVNFKRICEILKISVQGRNYARIKKGIKKLAKTSFDIELKSKTWTVERILNRAKGTSDYTVIEIDPWFYASFLNNEITRLDMNFRQSLRGDIAKCLYRFLSSHRGSQRYYLKTLVEAMNMSQDQDIKYHRRSLKAAFNQLQKRDFLTYRFRNDLFYDIKINLAG